ncbi:hypothetical protein RHS02_09960, partial [Rhizoctonia solani]
MHATYLAELAEEAEPTQEQGSRVGTSHPGVETHLEPNRNCVPSNKDKDVDKDAKDKWDAWYKEEDEEDNLGKLTIAGVKVNLIVDLEPSTKVEGRPWEEKAQTPGAKGADVSTKYYPNP